MGVWNLGEMSSWPRKQREQDLDRELRSSLASYVPARRTTKIDPMNRIDVRYE